MAMVSRAGLVGGGFPSRPRQGASRRTRMLPGEPVTLRLTAARCPSWPSPPKSQSARLSAAFTRSGRLRAPSAPPAPRIGDALACA